MNQSVRARTLSVVQQGGSRPDSRKFHYSTLKGDPQNVGNVRKIREHGVQFCSSEIQPETSGISLRKSVVRTGLRLEKRDASDIHLSDILSRVGGSGQGSIGTKDPLSQNIDKNKPGKAVKFSSRSYVPGREREKSTGTKIDTGKRSQLQRPSTRESISPTAERKSFFPKIPNPGGGGFSKEGSMLKHSQYGRPSSTGIIPDTYSKSSSFKLPYIGPTQYPLYPGQYEEPYRNLEGPKTIILRKGEIDPCQDTYIDITDLTDDCPIDVRIPTAVHIEPDPNITPPSSFPDSRRKKTLVGISSERRKPYMLPGKRKTEKASGSRQKIDLFSQMCERARGYSGVRKSKYRDNPLTEEELQEIREAQEQAELRATQFWKQKSREARGLRDDDLIDIDEEGAYLLGTAAESYSSKDPWYIDDPCKSNDLDGSKYKTLPKGTQFGLMPPHGQTDIKTKYPSQFSQEKPVPTLSQRVSQFFQTAQTKYPVTNVEECGCPSFTRPGPSSQIQPEIIPEDECLLTPEEQKSSSPKKSQVETSYQERAPRSLSGGRKSTSPQRTQIFTSKLPSQRLSPSRQTDEKYSQDLDYEPPFHELLPASTPKRLKIFPDSYDRRLSSARVRTDSPRQSRAGRQSVSPRLIDFQSILETLSPRQRSRSPQRQPDFLTGSATKMLRQDEDICSLLIGRDEPEVCLVDLDNSEIPTMKSFTARKSRTSPTRDSSHLVDWECEVPPPLPFDVTKNGSNEIDRMLKQSPDLKLMSPMKKSPRLVKAVVSNIDPSSAYIQDMPSGRVNGQCEQLDDSLGLIQEDDYTDYLSAETFHRPLIPKRPFSQYSPRSDDSMGILEQVDDFDELLTPQMQANIETRAFMREHAGGPKIEEERLNYPEECEGIDQSFEAQRADLLGLERSSSPSPQGVPHRRRGPYSHELLQQLDQDVVGYCDLLGMFSPPRMQGQPTVQFGQAAKELFTEVRGEDELINLEEEDRYEEPARPVRFGYANDLFTNVQWCPEMCERLNELWGPIPR